MHPTHASALATVTVAMNPDVILLNDFKRQWADTDGAVLAAVDRVGRSGWYILGDSVTQFETALAASAGAGFAVGCANGLDAIEIALRALELPRGARVLTTPLSAFATTLAIVRAGGVPVFVDVDERGNLDLDLCERFFAEGGGVSYMVPVHLYGHPIDLAHLSHLAARFGLRVVEDCAQAIEARSAGKKVATVGELSAFSFYPTKNLGALGDGGAVLGQSQAHRDACQSLRNYGQSTRYVHTRLGLNSRLDELQAAILDSVFLPRLAAWTTRRRHIAQSYLKGITHPRVVPLPVAADADPVWHLFAARVPRAYRQDFQDHLRDQSVQTAIHYPTLIPDQEAMRATSFEVWGELRGAREFTASEVSLPIHPYLTDGEVDRVINAVNGWRCP